MSFFELPGDIEQRPPAWFPQPGPQLEAIQATWCTELLYGGARGGGKSDYLLGDWLQDVEKYGESWQGIIFRKTLDDLKHLIRRSKQIYPQTGGIYRATSKEWQWPNGAVLRMSYLDKNSDSDRYQGHEFCWIGFDELSQWSTSEAYQMISACLRSSRSVPTKRIRSTANPGNIGHLWVKERFIDINPQGFEPYDDPESGMTRMFIPSSVHDNKILIKQDPDYVSRLKAVGSPELVRAWLDGDWNIIKGAYFPEFETKMHVVAPFEVPSHWMRFRSFDWGSAAPFVCLWIAVSDGTVPGVPKDCLVVYREWYGAKSPNKGLNLPNEHIARGIRERERSNEVIAYSVADPAIFKHDGGPSIAEVMHKEGVNFRRADNARIPGWGNIRSRLIGNDDGPMLLFFATTRHCIRTLPAMQHDERRPEDINTEGDDHCADTLRYGCMSRPFLRKKDIAKKPKTLDNATMNDLWDSSRKTEKSSEWKPV